MARYLDDMRARVARCYRLTDKAVVVDQDERIKTAHRQRFAYRLQLELSGRPVVIEAAHDQPTRRATVHVELRFCCVREGLGPTGQVHYRMITGQQLQIPDPVFDRPVVNAQRVELVPVLGARLVLQYRRKPVLVVEMCSINISEDKHCRCLLNTGAHNDRMIPAPDKITGYLYLPE